MSYCVNPFQDLIVNIDGSVFLCCPPFVDNKSIGNIFYDTLENIWQGDRAKKFRDSIIDLSYRYCNRNLCGGGYLCDSREYIDTLQKIKKPASVTLDIDGTCNLKCPMCREDYFKDFNLIEKLEPIIYSSIIPFLASDVLELKMNGRGEFFTSSICKKIAKEACSLNSKLRLVLWTNGILCNEENINEIGGFDKISKIRVSCHATSEKTYNKIMVSDNKNNFKTLMKNLEWLASQKIDTKVEIVFVVSSINYKEMKDMMKFAKKIGLFVVFWAIDDRSSYTNNHMSELDISNSHHKKHKEFLKILKDSIFDEGCEFVGYLNTLRNNIRANNS